MFEWLFGKRKEPSPKNTSSRSISDDGDFSTIDDGSSFVDTADFSDDDRNTGSDSSNSSSDSGGDSDSGSSDSGGD